MWVNCKYRRLSHHGRGWRRSPGDLRDIAFHDIPPSPSVSRSGIPPHSKSHIMDHAHGRQQSDLKMKCFGLESKLFQPHNRCILTFPGNYAMSLGMGLGWGYDNLSQIWWMSGLWVRGIISLSQSITARTRPGLTEPDDEKNIARFAFIWDGRAGTFASFMPETWYPCVCHFSHHGIKT